MLFLSNDFLPKEDFPSQCLSLRMPSSPRKVSHPNAFPSQGSFPIPRKISHLFHFLAPWLSSPRKSSHPSNHFSSHSSFPIPTISHFHHPKDSLASPQLDRDPNRDLHDSGRCKGMDTWRANDCTLFQSNTDQRYQERYDESGEDVDRWFLQVLPGNKQVSALLSSYLSKRSEG